MSKSKHRDTHERRIRKEVRALLKSYEYKKISKDDFVRAVYELVDDERRRAFMSMAPAGVQAMATYDIISKTIADQSYRWPGE